MIKYQIKDRYLSYPDTIRISRYYQKIAKTTKDFQKKKTLNDFLFRKTTKKLLPAGRSYDHMTIYEIYVTIIRSSRSLLLFIRLYLDQI